MKQTMEVTRVTVADKNTTTRRDYEQLLSDFAESYTRTQHGTHGTQEEKQAYVTDLTDLAVTVARSVLRKCIWTSSNPTLIELRNELSTDIHMIHNTTYCNSHARTLHYTDNGDVDSTVLDEYLDKALNRLSHDRLGDGVDLTHDAIVAILEECKKQEERGESINLESSYTIRRLKKKVWIKVEDSVGGWETVETVLIREVYKHVRRSINTSRAAATDPRNGYSYLADISTDEESGEEETIYRRMSKYADLGGYATDAYSHRETLYSIDQESVDRCDAIIAALHLTKKQAQILALRQSGSGYGYKAIATKLGVTENSVKSACREMARKAERAGYKPRM